MSLKGDRELLQTDVTYWINEAAVRGKVVWLSAGGSGLALDNQGTATDPKPLVTGTGSPSGKVPVGILLNDFVNIDTSLYRVNYYKDEKAIPDKCTVLKKGWVYTNNIVGNPSAQQNAYVTTNGSLTPTISATGGLAATPLVGKFITSLDEDGYARVEVNLPYLM